MTFRLRQMFLKWKSTNSLLRPHFTRSSLLLPSTLLLLGGAFLSTTTIVSASAKKNDASATSQIFLTNIRKDGTSSSKPKTDRPIIVFIHGLDSSKDTWSTVMDDLSKAGYPSIALDLRGHGESPLGNEADFLPLQVTNDINYTLNKLSISKFILVGHSMGGRVVMRYAANYPHSILALIIEDMDVHSRQFSDSTIFTENEIQRRRLFNRQFNNTNECIKTLATYGYDTNRIKDWISTGRIFTKKLEEGGSVKDIIWSSINPFAQYLAYKNIICSNDGKEAFFQLSQMKLNFPIHLYVAGKGSVCNIKGEGGVEDMQKTLASLKVSYFPESGHSIHNTGRQEFVDKLKVIVDGLFHAN